MENLQNLPWRIMKSQSGLTSLEYALAAALVGVVIIASIVAVGINLSGNFTTIATSIETSGNRAANDLGNGDGVGETASTGGHKSGSKKTDGSFVSTGGGSKTVVSTGGGSKTVVSTGGGSKTVVSTGGGSKTVVSTGGGSKTVVSTGRGRDDDTAGETVCDPSGNTACDSAGDTASTGAASGRTGSITSSLGRTNFGRTGFSGTGTSSRRPDRTNTTGRNSGGTGTELSFALASHDSTDGLGQSAKGSSSVATGSGDGMVNAGTVSPGSGIGSEEYQNEVAGTHYYSPDAINLLILLAGFLALGVLIWYAFHRLRAGTKKNRQLDEWQKDKNKRPNVRDLNIFRNNQQRAA